MNLYERYFEKLKKKREDQIYGMIYFTELSDGTLPAWKHGE